MRVGLVSVARATFDASQVAEERAAMSHLLRAEHGDGRSLRLVEVGSPLTGATDAAEAVGPLNGEALDALVVHQGTFADASILFELVRELPFPVILWAVPEPVSETGRLRLNSFCGTNLAANTLYRIGHPYAAVYGSVGRTAAIDILKQASAFAAVRKVREARVLVLGEAPRGFFPSQVDPLEVAGTLGARVERVSLQALFRRANELPEERVRDAVREETRHLRGADEIPLAQVTQSVSAQLAIEELCREMGAAAVAVECWPDFMVEFGGAACWSMSRLIDRGIMGGCEADVYGALTMMMQHTITGTAPFFADLVEVKSEENAGTFWHCGAAPLSLGNPEEVRASRQPNRQVGLTLDFGLRPGRVTVAKLCRGRDGVRLFVTSGEALERPAQYRGNTMVVRFDADADDLVQLIFDEGLEHHYSVAYGDMRRELKLIARRLEIPVVEG